MAKCSCKRNKIGRPMRRGTKKYTGALVTGAQIAGGFIAAKMVNRVIPATVNPDIISGAKALIGVVLAGTQKGALADVGTGMIVAGGTELVSKALPQVAGLAGPSIGSLPFRMRDVATKNQIAGMPAENLVD